MDSRESLPQQYGTVQKELRAVLGEVVRVLRPGGEARLHPLQISTDLPPLGEEFMKELAKLVDSQECKVELKYKGRLSLDSHGDPQHPKNYTDSYVVRIIKAPFPQLS